MFVQRLSDHSDLCLYSRDNKFGPFAAIHTVLVVRGRDRSEEKGELLLPDSAPNRSLVVSSDRHLLDCDPSVGHCVHRSVAVVAADHSPNADSDHSVL